MSKKGIDELKKEYEEISMSKPQVDAFKQSIEQAKKDNRRMKRMRGWKVAGVAVAAVFLAFILLPKIAISEKKETDDGIVTADAWEEEGGLAYDGGNMDVSPTAYTLELKTGEDSELADLFVEDADYIGVISEEIIRQMREQMASDENVWYWLDEEAEELNFKSITDETRFCINENNNIVICFDEGVVAPMYMGAVTFEIPNEVVEAIRK